MERALIEENLALRSAEVKMAGHRPALRPPGGVPLHDAALRVSLASLRYHMKGFSI
jgi:hypothetical protein